MSNLMKILSSRTVLVGLATIVAAGLQAFIDGPTWQNILTAVAGAAVAYFRVNAKSILL